MPIDAPVVVEAAPAEVSTLDAGAVAAGVLALGAAATVGSLLWQRLARAVGAPADVPERQPTRRERRLARALRKRLYFKRLRATTTPARSSGSRARQRNRVWRRRNPKLGKP